MKIAILAFRKNFGNYENKALYNSALKKGINLTFIDPDEVEIKLENNKAIILNNNEQIKNIDFLFVRVGCMINTHIKHVINAFEINNTIVSHKSSEVELCADKFNTHLTLLNNNIPTINSIKSRNLTNYNLNYPVVFKSNTGSLGKGIYKANSKEELKNLIDHSNLLDSKYDYIIQDLVKESYGKDLRVFVVNKKIIAIIKRESNGEDFRANFSLYNNASEYEIDDKIIKIVNDITNIYDGFLLGIDLFFKDDNYLVCEVNSAAGYKGIETVYKDINISNIIIDEIKEVV